MQTTRRTFLGGLAAISVPAAAAAAAVGETQEDKCIRLTQELLVEIGQIDPHGESRFGQYVDLRFGNRNFARYGRSDTGGEMLTVFIQDTEVG